MGRLWRRLLVGAAAALALTPVALQATPALALPGGGGHTDGFGFDACTAPSQTAMNAFWSNTRFTWMGVYVGGESRACSQPNLTASWLNTNYASGSKWRFMFLYVGLQAPCTTFQSRMSSNTSTAHRQGVTAAENVFTDLVNLGIGNNAAGTPVYFDLEAYDTSNSSCVAAVKSFMQGWVSQIHVAPAQLAGVYGSACGSDLNALFSLSPRPDAINAASWDGNPSTSALPCIASSHWNSNNRIKQYQGGHNETFNGVTLNIDSDCSNGPLAPTASNFTNTACA